MKPTNLLAMLQNTIKRVPSNPAFGEKKEGKWNYIDYRTLGTLVDNCRSGLAMLNIQPGDRIAIISNNRLEWIVSAFALYGLGAWDVPMYEKQNPVEWEYIVKDSQAKILIVSNEKIKQQLVHLETQLNSLQKIIVMDGPQEHKDSFSYLLDQGQKNPVPPHQPDKDDVASIMYTSGSTGIPKGVILTHHNIISNISSFVKVMPFDERDRTLAFMPWAHTMGKIGELYASIYLGSSVAICDAPEKLMEYLPEVKPTVLIAVPRVFNRMYDGIYKKLDQAPAYKKYIFTYALHIAQKARQTDGIFFYRKLLSLTNKLVGWLVFSPIKKRLGGRLRYAITGGAATSKTVAEFITNIGITVFEVYGITEASPVISLNWPGSVKLGSVGQPLSDVEVFIDTAVMNEDESHIGEILVKGPNVTQGYFNLPDETQKALRPDGAFKTGDLGYFDNDNYLHIQGRLKEQYKLENGKFVAPAPLEERVRLSGYINQLYIHGENKPYNVALIVPDHDALLAWAEENQINGDISTLIRHHLVQKFYSSEVDRLSKEGFKRFERIKALRLISEEFTTENDMLTPTLKLKRRNIIKNFDSIIQEMYV